MALITRPVHQTGWDLANATGVSAAEREPAVARRQLASFTGAARRAV